MRRAAIAMGIAIISGGALLSFAGSIQGGDTNALWGLVLSFISFGISAPYAVYAYNRYKGATHDTPEEVLKREQQRYDMTKEKIR